MHSSLPGGGVIAQRSGIGRHYAGPSLAPRSLRHDFVLLANQELSVQQMPFKLVNTISILIRQCEITTSHISPLWRNTLPFPASPYHNVVPRNRLKVIMVMYKSLPSMSA